MATKRKTYVEPTSYFSPGMRKTVEEWEKKNETKQKQPAKTGGKKK